MKKLFLILLMNIFLAGVLVAQNDVFSVILNKGDNYYSSKTTINQVVLGTTLSHDDMLKVVDGGYVALVHEGTGTSVELNESGNYLVKDLENNLKSQSSSLLAKYGKFLLSQLYPEDNGNQNLNVTGAVQRGDANIIKVNLPKVIDVFENRIYIAWQQVDDVQRYTLTIKDRFDDIILEKPVVGFHCPLDLRKDGLENEKLIIINVRATEIENLRSPDFGIKRLADVERKSIGTEFINIKKVARRDAVLDKLLIASFFEENQLLADAITYYNEALEISPDPDGFRLLYNNFLTRNGLIN